jgi:hypothetical protein
MNYRFDYQYFYSDTDSIEGKKTSFRFFDNHMGFCTPDGCVSKKRVFKQMYSSGWWFAAGICLFTGFFFFLFFFLRLFFFLLRLLFF